LDFFTRQEKSKRTTRYLVLLFSLAFFGVAAAATLAVGFVLDFLPSLDTPLLTTTLDRERQSNLSALGALLGAMMLLMLLASLYRAATLSRGGSQVARLLGGSEIRSDSSDPLHRRLVNVVEEISIASGVPVPDIFVLDQEPGINAFAAGLSHSDAAIAVTQGALEKLQRDELQGVIAHEFSHILNGDMRINQQLVGYSYGILVLSLAGRWLLRSSRMSMRSRSRGGSIAVVLGIALTVIGAIGIFFSRLIKAAVSRQREILADASAVQFTREPSALASALKRIAGFTTTLTSVDGEEVAHMLFGPGSTAFTGLFATHPPLLERIRALDPGFDPEQYERIVSGAEPHRRDVADAAAFAARSGTDADNETVLSQTGSMGAPNIGRALHALMPDVLLSAAHSRDSSIPLVLAMALSPTADTAKRQLQLLAQRLGAEQSGQCADYRAEIDRIGEELRLPLLELAVPALKQRPDEQVRFIFDMLRDVLAVDSDYRLFSYILPRVLDAYLSGRAASHVAKRHGNLPRPEQAAYALLDAIAAVGHDDHETAAAAYRAGVAVLYPQRDPQEIERYTTDSIVARLKRLDLAIQALARLTLQDKRRILRATLATVRHDTRIRRGEIELYRTVAASLGCPVPPLEAGAATQEA
jgi:Zn-dependent protease with chaperone function